MKEDSIQDKRDKLDKVIESKRKERGIVKVIRSEEHIGYDIQICTGDRKYLGTT